MAGDRRLQQLATELDEAINRIEILQKGPKALPWSARVSNHFSKHGGNILNVVVAGIAFTLAAQRLAMKHELEVTQLSLLQTTSCPGLYEECTRSLRFLKKRYLFPADIGSGSHCGIWDRCRQQGLHGRKRGTSCSWRRTGKRHVNVGCISRAWYFHSAPLIGSWVS
jgi:hypothetical protein